MLNLENLSQQRVPHNLTEGARGLLHNTITTKKRKGYFLEETKILLVEDDPDHADLIIDVLESENINKEVVLMKDGREAINYLEKTYIDKGNEIQSQIYLIILDLNLPRVHGMDVLKFIKQNSEYSSIPVVVLTTSSDHKTLGEAYKYGANGYITKPLTHEDFVDKITMIRNLVK